MLNFFYFYLDPWQLSYIIQIISTLLTKSTGAIAIKIKFVENKTSHLDPVQE